jgi:NADPH:quinone reductase-like Zn-dependent oxidoreductase
MAGLPYLVRIAGFGVRVPKQPVLGLDLAGVIERTGDGVTDLSVGDRVFGIGDGSFAEYAVAKAAKLAPIPDGVPFEQAAATPVSGITALEAVRKHAVIAEGESVLVLGASGGVGSFAVQIAKAEGATVTGVASAAKVDLVQGLGADHFLDYQTDPLDRHGPYDAIIDTGGNRGLGELRKLMSPTGRLIIVGGEGGDRLTGGVHRQVRAMLLSLTTKQKLGTFISSEKGTLVAELGGLIASGQLKPAIDRSFPLERTKDAIAHMLDGKARGKIVISIA